MMARKEKRKLCWNCEGDVARTEANCPYCGVYLHPNQDEDDEDALDIEPPYDPEEPKEERLFAAPYSRKSRPEEKAPPPSLPAAERISSETKDEIRKVLIPLSFMLCGSILFLFGMMLFLFSHHGVLTLHWDATYWIFYLAIALPLLFLGWHYLDPAPKEEERAANYK